MTGFASHFEPEEEYVLVSLVAGLRTLLDATDDSIIRKMYNEPGASRTRFFSNRAESAKVLSRVCSVCASVLHRTRHPGHVAVIQLPTRNHGRVSRIYFVCLDFSK